MIKRAEGIVCHDGLLLMLEFCGIDVLHLQYKTRYLEMYQKDLQAAAQTSDTTNKSRLGRSTVSKAKRLLRELSDDEDESSGTRTNIGTQESCAEDHQPWLQDFHGYLNSPDHLGDITIIRWWGVRLPRSWFCKRRYSRANLAL